MSAANRAAEREREGTFDAPDHIRIPDLPDASVVEDSRVRLTATYWDTFQRRLLKWAHTLRHRRASDGSEDRWTLKLAVPTRRTKGELAREEVHGSGTALFPPPRSGRSRARSSAKACSNRSRPSSRSGTVSSSTTKRNGSR